MLWSPNEVLAYLKEDLNLQNNGTKESTGSSKRAAFGGFPPWLSATNDFVFIAENSEIYGPNPLFTIPCQSKDIDLNLLSTRILSADYQGLSCKKIVSLEHAQLLMPDIAGNINIAVNYFLLFDTEARGFIRPTCIAYVTSDKYKLISSADSILKALSEASTILQHCNMLHTIDGLKTMLQEKTFHHDETVKSKMTEDVKQDIQDIIDVIEAYKGNSVIDKQVSAILEYFKEVGVFSEVNKLLNPHGISSTQSLHRKNKNIHSLEKRMKSLYLICGNGVILGLYHLYVMHKHFRRKYEDIYLEKHFGSQKSNDKKLHFGACMKASSVDIFNFAAKDCILGAKRISRMPSMDSDQYFLSLDAAFEKVLLDFLHGETNLCLNLKKNRSFHQSSDCSDISAECEISSSSSSGYLSRESEDTGYCNTYPCGHVVPLESIWDILEDLQRNNSGIESAFLEIIKLFDDTKRILFSVFTRTPVVIISTPEESMTAQNFITALSIFIPRRADEILVVETNRQEPLNAELMQYIVAFNICVHQNKAVEEIIPQHLWHSLCILNLIDCSLTAPAYTGILLSNIDERFRMLPLEGPAFPIIVGILCEVQRALQWWHMVTLPSVDDSVATSAGYSRMDVEILLKLSKLCRH